MNTTSQEIFKQDTPFVSIVIPTYNRAHLIAKTIQSVLAQEDQDFEVIVVDDGSKDNTEEVVRRVQDERVSYYRKENAERGAARNYGTVRSRGQYVYFLDSDDILYPHHLGVARRLIEQQGRPEILHLGYELRHADGTLLIRYDSLKGEVNDQLLARNLLGCNGNFLRQDIARAFPFNEDRRLSGSEDWELWLRLASRYPIHYSNEVTSILTNHEERSVLCGSEDALLDCKRLTLQYLFQDQTFVDKYGRRRNYIESEFLSYIALHLALWGRPSRAFKYLRDASLMRPSSVFSRRFLAVVKHIILNSRKGNR